MFAVLRIALLIGVTAFLFYRSFLAVFALLPVGVWFFLDWERECIRKKQLEFEEQFKEAIQSVASSLQVGYSIENAIRETKKDLGIVYREDTAIQREFSHMVQQVYLQVPAEKIMEDWAERVNQEDVWNFVNVFVLARKSGGNTIGIIRSCVSQIRQKIEVREEIETILAARKYEFKVMSVIPFGMIAYMRMSFPEFMEILYGNLIGIGVMSGCLMVYFGAFLLGRKIVNIEM